MPHHSQMQCNAFVYQMLHLASTSTLAQYMSLADSCLSRAPHKAAAAASHHRPRRAVDSRADDPRAVEQREAFSDWVFRRCYAVSLAVVLVLTVQNMRGLLPVLGNHDSQELPTGSSLCSDILEVAIYVPHFAGVVASWYYTFTRWRRDGGSYPLLIRHCLSRQVCLHCTCVLLFLVVMTFQIF